MRILSGQLGCMSWKGGRVNIVKRIGVGRRAGVALVRLGPDPVRLSNPVTRFRWLLIYNRQVSNNESLGAFTCISILTPLPELLIQSEFPGEQIASTEDMSREAIDFEPFASECINELVARLTGTALYRNDPGPRRSVPIVPLDAMSIRR